MSSRLDSSETVEVLLATFNGESFLREQIDSILGQDYADLRVLARDDGSSDGTVDILNKYHERFPDRFRLLPTDRPSGGAKWNFLKLMKASKANYISFCDQDDVWLPNKVSSSMNAMRELESNWGRSIPFLVFTDLQLVDSNLRVLHRSFWEFMSIDPSDIHRLNRVLMVCVVTGCTAMVNRPLLELAKRMPSEASMHDRWIGLIAATMGKATIIRKQTVLYRQHGKNILGTGKDLTGQAVPKPKRSGSERLSDWRHGASFSHWTEAQRHAAAYLEVYGDELDLPTRRVLDAFRRCELDDRRLVRFLTLIRYRFYDPGILPNLAKLAILWNRR
jgi:glycosyltransferase involved in cell wall biosynthesis